MRSLLFVAGKTHLRLGAFVTDFIVRSMHLVARGTGDVVGFMRTTDPEMALSVFLVAAQARIVAFMGGVF